MKYKKKYQRIVDELIKKSFPELIGKKIFIFETSKLFKWFSGFTFLGINKSYILINKNIRGLTKKEIKGLLSHELCHVVDLRKKSFICYWLKIIPYQISWLVGGKIVNEIENKTDKQAIKRGYAHELYSFEKWREKRTSKKVLAKSYKKGYLSPEQIKSYAKLIGKW